MNNNKTKNIILAVLVIGLVGMTIAYASLTQTLTINNNEVTVSSKWRVRFAPTVTTSVGTTVSGGTTGASYTSNTPIVTNDQQTITGLQATFTKPGDYVEVAFSVRNEGNIAAKGQSVTISLGNLTCANGTGSSIDSGVLSTFCGNLTKWVRHSDRTTGWTSADTLAAYSGSGNDYPHIDGILRIEYPSTLTASDIAGINGGSVVVTLGDTTLHFEQNDGSSSVTAWSPSYYAYGTPTTADTSYPSNHDLFAAMDTSGNYGVCIRKSGNVYCFKANDATNQRQVAEQTFTSSECWGAANSYLCGDTSDYYISIAVSGTNLGDVRAYYNNMADKCYAYHDNTVCCGSSCPSN